MPNSFFEADITVSTTRCNQAAGTAYNRQERNILICDGMWNDVLYRTGRKIETIPVTAIIT